MGCCLATSQSLTTTWADTTAFVPPISSGLVIKVYDGDTITVAQRLPYSTSPLYRFSVRLAGIDSPELTSSDPAEKRCAQESRDALHTLLFQKTVTLTNTATEKYGRLLADVHLGSLHVNRWMLTNRYAIPYDGGRKKKWQEVRTTK